MSRLAVIFVVGAVLSAPFLWTGSALAQGVIASEIIVEGVQRIEPETVRSYVPIKPGDPITARGMDDALKKLFATGLFADVIVRRQGRAVVVRIVENPIINRIAFEGNRRIESDVLKDEVKLRPRIVYTRARVQGDVQRIIDVYRRNGRFAASVEPKVIQLEQNRVDLVFEIKEGPRTEIRRVTFVGNRRFSDSRLRGVVRTKETAWYRFLTTDDTYDPDRLTFDRELLRRFYLSQGFADFRVVSGIAELAPDREGFFITFTIEEGNRYRFGKVDVIAALRDLSADQLRDQVTINQGDWYNADAVESVITKLTEVVGNLGYAFVDIRPQVKRSRSERTIDVTFRIQEGPRVFVEQIEISGNVRTIDKVIRREFSLVEGDAFNASKLKRARRRIRNLGFFGKVNITNVAGGSPDKTIIKASVQEMPTGEISFGAGFSSSVGLLGDVGVRERNLLGRGQDLFLRFQVSAESSEIDLQFTEPYFLDRKLSAGIDVFSVTRDLRDESSFERQSLGVGFRLGYDLSEFLRHQVRYRISRERVTDVTPTASLAILEQQGSEVKSEISQGFVYDTRDSRFLPREGLFATYNLDLAGLGGSVKFIRNRLNAVKYFPLTETLTGSIGASAGYIFAIGDDTRIIDRFFLGGNSLRGFENFGVGPRDTGTDDALGGDWFYTATAQLVFPLGLPNEFGIRGRAFTDLGSLGKADTGTGSNVNDTRSIRASFGLGISWSSPFGPVSMDIAFPILKENFDRTETVRFNFGTRF